MCRFREAKVEAISRFTTLLSTLRQSLMGGLITKLLTLSSFCFEPDFLCDLSLFVLWLPHQLNKEK